MSLVGSLEDLGLGDILQIISLSRKSGVLLLRSEHGEGRILFREGRVTGAFRKGGPTDLRSLLVGRGVLSEEEFAAAARTARAGDADLETALCAHPSLGRVRLDEIRKENVERAAFAMFSWPTGEFSFDVGEAFENLDAALCLETGIDAQYLAMEGARLRDEAERDEGAPPDTGDPASFADLGAELRADDPRAPARPAGGAAAPPGAEEAVEAEPLDDAEPAWAEPASDEAPDAGSLRAADLVARAAVEAGDDGEEGEVLELEEAAEAEVLDAEEAAEGGLPEAEEPSEGEVLEFEDASEDEVPGAEAASEGEVLELEEAAEGEVLDPGDAVEGEILELEEAVEDEAPGAGGPAEGDDRFAVRSAAGSGAAAPAAAAAPRSAAPVVVVDPDLAVLEWAKQALSADHQRVHIFQKTDLAIARIRQYLVRREAPVVVLSENAPPDPNSGARTPAEIITRLRSQARRLPVLLLGAEGQGDSRGADGIAVRPSATDLYHPRRADVVARRREELREAVAAVRQAPAPPAGAPAGQGLRRLREVSAALREAAPQGGIIPVVLRFAAEHFRRVAMFFVRDGLAVGMAGIGLERAGGPGDAGLRDIALRADQPAWFRKVIETRAAVRGPLGDEGDRTLVELLGDRVPEEAYVAPLEGGEHIVGLLYADNLPDGGPLGDTSALEVILHEAGLALDRAALERQLAEAETA